MLVLDSGARRHSSKALGNRAVLGAVKRLEACRSDFQIIVFGLQLGLLCLELINLVAIRIGLSHLREVQKAQQTRKYNKNNSVANGAECPFFGAEAHRVLATAGILLPTRCH